MAVAFQRLCVDPSFRAFTIHDASQNMYMTPSVNLAKPKAIIFKRSVDAIRVVRLMECTVTFSKDVNDAHTDSFDPARELYVRSWSLSKFHEYCEKNDMDYTYMTLTDGSSSHEFA